MEAESSGLGMAVGLGVLIDVHRGNTESNARGERIKVLDISL